ncbi:MAG: antitoxin family protein [Methanothrix sp.]|nr:antitoxin family protein [Methanothrix sp.]
MSGPNTIECVYEGGVLRPLHEVDFREGERLKLTVRKFDISRFYGAFGEGSMGEFEKFEEDAQMGRCGLSKYYGILGKASAERLAELEESNDSEVLELLPIEANTEIGSSVRKTKGIIKLDPAIARDIADSDE